MVGSGYPQQRYPQQRYTERLVPGPLTWIVALLFITMLAIAYGAALGGAVGWLGGLATSVLAAVLIWFGSPMLRVDQDGFTAGRARLPASALGAAEVIPGEDVRARRDRDARVFVLVRPMCAKTAVAVQVCDPADPHPEWIVTSRHPQQLVDSLLAVTHREDA